MSANTRERDGRQEPIVIDLKRLEEQAEVLFLHRFVEHVRQTRKENGRFLTLRAGDQLAIAAAGDGSVEILEDVAQSSPTIPT